MLLNKQPYSTRRDYNDVLYGNQNGSYNANGLAHLSQEGVLLFRLQYKFLFLQNSFRLARTLLDEKPSRFHVKVFPRPLRVTYEKMRAGM